MFVSMQFNLLNHAPGHVPSHYYIKLSYVSSLSSELHWIENKSSKFYLRENKSLRPKLNISLNYINQIGHLSFISYINENLIPKLLEKCLILLVQPTFFLF